MRSDPETKSGSRHSAGTEPLRRKRVLPVPTSAIRRPVRILLVFATIVLIVDALVGQKGLIEAMRARRQYRETADSLASARRENDQLRDLARRLRDDPQAIESVAREQLGLIREGEILFIIKDGQPVINDPTVR